MTDPRQVADALKSSSDADALARALLEEYASQAPLHWDVGANEMLIMRPGWNAGREPEDYLWVSTRA